MAISHVQPLLLLLASLFFLPVFCAIKFDNCNNNIEDDFANITRVAMDAKDDDSTILVFGIANKSLKQGTLIVKGFTGKSEPVGISLYLLDQVADALPIKPGNKFVLTLTQVPLQDSLTYDAITVTLFDEDYRSEYEVMCIKFNPFNSTTSSALSE